MPTIRVTGGLVQGTPCLFDPSITEYRGIPYAAPPTGSNRFRSPQPVIPWDGIRTSSQSAVCLQAPPPPRFFDVLAGAEQSEDMLYLNLWTPNEDRHGEDKPWPVYMWIHGGGYREGGNADLVFNGVGMAQKGVIMVVPNFRLGFLGFLAHPELSKESPSGTSGNQGILDCIQALQWIQDNIANFGGDTARVTVGGQSSGSAMAHIIALSPLSRGLISGAIIQSGPRHPRDPAVANLAASYRKLDTAEEDGEALCAELGCSSIAELRHYADARHLQDCAKRRDLKYFGGPPLFRATLDGHVLTQTYEASYRTGPPRDIPLLVGSNADEGGTYHDDRLTAEDIRQCVLERFSLPHGNGDPSFITRFHALYPIDGRRHPTEVWNEAARDSSRVNLSLFAGQYNQVARSPVWGYHFTQAPPEWIGHSPPNSEPKVLGYTPNKGPLTGAYHSAELSYAINSLQADSRRPWRPQDFEVASRMSDYWSNFIKSGDPNGRNASGTRWPSLSEDGQSLMEIGGRWQPIRITLTDDKERFWRDWAAAQPEHRGF